MMKSHLLVIVLLLLISLSIPLSSSNPGQLYSVTFEEKGLPYGMNWSVTENGQVLTSTGNIIFHLANGSYVFTVSPIGGYTANRYSFNVTVAGDNITETVYWGEVYYPVTFREIGLNAGTLWNVTAGFQTVSSTSQTMVFELANGTYQYSIPPVNGTLPSPSSGRIVVSGSPLTVILYFRIPVNITFLVTGLSGGSYWSVTIDNRTYGSTEPFIYVSTLNGSYSYKVNLPFNYYASHPTGKVSGNTLVFVQANSFIPWEVLIAVIVIVDVFIVARIRKSRSASRKQQQQ